MKLYWHRWRHHYGVAYLLFDRPQTHGDSVRSLGELAIVMRIAGRWRAQANQIGAAASKYWLTGSPVSGRRLIQQWIDSRSIAMFESDCVEFIPADSQK